MMGRAGCRNGRPEGAGGMKETEERHENMRRAEQKKKA